LKESSSQSNRYGIGGVGIVWQRWSFPQIMDKHGGDLFFWGVSLAGNGFFDLRGGQE